MERTNLYLKSKGKITEETFHESLTSCWAVDVLPPELIAIVLGGGCSNGPLQVLMMFIRWAFEDLFAAS